MAWFCTLCGTRHERPLPRTITVAAPTGGIIKGTRGYRCVNADRADHVAKGYALVTAEQANAEVGARAA